MVILRQCGDASLVYAGYPYDHRYTELLLEGPDQNVRQPAPSREHGGRALADYYDEVTLIDRDALPLRYKPRKGVPQGRHTHGLLARGRRVNAGSIRNRIRND